MKNKFLRSFIFLLLIAQVGWAQERITVKGVVRSLAGSEPLPGVNVLQEGGTSGTVTDIDGRYSLEIPSDAVLVFSSIGYTAQKINVNGKSTIDVELADDVTELEEFVVVGYGTQRKEELTGSIGVVSSEKLEQVPASSFQAALQGNAPGLQAVTADGAPGANVNIRVRGIGSINAANDPLYVIDGIPVSNGDLSQTDFGNDGRSSNVLSSMNPNDIESVTILKDAASTAIYGSRGANGVVLITTKNGKKGEAMIDLKTQVGFSNFAYQNLLQPLNNAQYKELYVEGYTNQGETVDEAMARYNQQFPEDANTNWLDELYQTGVTQQYDLSASGGSEKLTYYASGSYYDQEGTIIGTGFTRYSSRLNMSAELTDRLSLTNNINVSHFNQTSITDGTRWQAPMYLAYLLPPAVPVKDDQGRYYGEHTFLIGANNPVGSQSGDDNRELSQTRILDNLTASYRITDDLSFKTAWNFDIINIDEFLFANARYGDGRNVGGTGQSAQQRQISWLGTQTLTYGKTFNNIHNLDALLGYESQKVTRNLAMAEAQGYADPRLRNLESAANPTNATSEVQEYAFTSFFSRVNYDYDNKYFLSLSLRSDGSSRFGPENRWGTFWSVGGGLTLNKLGFLQDVNAINFMKLRASYGITGNADLDGNYLWAATYGFDRAYNGSPAGAPNQVGNPFLTWESQENFNIGLDFTIYDRFNGTVEYFQRNSSDLLLERPLSRTTGFTNITENVGDMMNRGFEINLNADIVSSDSWNWTMGGNITFLKNEITRLPDPILDGTFNRAEGRDYQEYYLYGWAGVNPDDGAPMWYTDDTKQETTSDINEAVRFYDGKSATPKSFGGLNTTVSYKGFSLSAQMNFQAGNYVYDGPGWVIHGDGRFTPRSTSTYAYENRWQQPGDNAKFPQFVWGNTSNSNTQNSTRYLFRGDFMRLRNVTLAYNVPSSFLDRIKLRSLRAYVSANNYLTWVKDKDLYFDPEQTINGVYNTVVPISKTFTVGLNFGF